MLGEGWVSPVHRDRLEQHVGLPQELLVKSKEEAFGDRNKDNEEDKANENKDAKQDDGLDPLRKGDVGEPSKDVNLPEDMSNDMTQDSDVEEDRYSRSLSEYIKDGQFLFLPPAR